MSHVDLFEAHTDHARYALSKIGTMGAADAAQESSALAIDVMLTRMKLIGALVDDIKGALYRQQQIALRRENESQRDERASLVETVNILSDDETMAAVAEAEAESTGYGDR